MNLIRQCRHTLGLTQPQFAKWLANEIGRPEPFPASRISEFEHGVYGLNVTLRKACAPVVVKSVLKELRNTPRANHEQILLEVIR